MDREPNPVQVPPRPGLFLGNREEIGLGRALEIDERARRSTDSRGPEAEIDHLGSFQALI